MSNMIEINSLIAQFTWIIRSAKDENKLKKIEKRIIQIEGSLPVELKIELDKKKTAIQGNLFT